MLSVTVIGGKASEDLAKKLSKRLKADFISSDLRIFPDGESKITINANPKKGKIIIVNSTYPPVDSNLMQTLSLIAKARQFSSDVISVIPYLGYARQDREFLPGEIVTLSVIAKLLKASGASKVIVVDIHSQMGLKHFDIPIKNVSAVQELVNHFKKLKLKDPLVVSPDLGGATRAEEFAKLYGTDFIALKKQRDRKTGKVEIMTLNLDGVKGRDLVLVDDMISTGGSIVKATEFLRKQKCGKVYVACTHALLIDSAENKIRKAGISGIISTNTIPGNTSVVDVSGIIAKAI
ncbi:ribose-phosphate diphosphokinase [Candidatus Nitrosotenuis chungbukensis]|uniref:ribose-phosphate diphosphokinase n=1 Tax=Candidatus Nitrosotenuis chungbukensis TaxID=1353246 RepID=UPI0005B2811A|nr:ribose-phosphate pyrophosphokinase [Candidatus Nitrosotenuis chungbukensis]